MRLKKSFLGILLSLALVLVLMPGMNMTAYAITTYPLWVGGTQVTSENASNIDGSNKASYNDTTKTLTLKDFNFNNSGNGIYYTGTDELNIELTQINTITSTNDNGIRAIGALKFSGTGSLLVKGQSLGAIYTGNGITIAGGTLTAEGGNSGIRSEGDVTINGGTVTTKGNFSLYAENSITIGGGNVNATGSVVGISAKRVEVKNGTVIATGTSTSDSRGIDATAGEVKIKNGTVSATGTTGIFADGDVTISGGTVKATGNKGNGIEARSGGSSGIVTIDGGNVTVIGKKSTEEHSAPAYGIYAQKTVKIGSGVSNVVISGTSNAIYANNGTNGVINALAGTGWTNMEGTTGKADIGISSTGQTLDYKKVQFPAESSSDTGNIEEKVDRKDNTPAANVTGLDDDLANSIMTADEKGKVAGGQEATLTLEMTNKDSSVSDEEKSLTGNALKNVNPTAKVGMFFDMSLILRIGASYSRSVTELGNKSIDVDFEIPASLRAPAGVNRIFYLFHIHKGEAKNIASTKSNNMKASINGLSTFAIAYADEVNDNTASFNTSITTKQKDGKLKISWDKFKGAASYKVYATYCGNKLPKSATKKTSGTSIKIKKLKGKKIDFSKNFKLYIEAFDANGNSLGKTPTAHIAGKNNSKYTNTKSISVSAKSVALSVGGTSKIKASQKLSDKGKKLLSDNHTKKFRYRSDNTSVATVNKSGTITAVSTGSCNIYVYAKNGLAKKVTITVN